jgi:hypothetical protein
MIVSAGGREWLIDIGRTQLIQARGEAGAIEFIKDVLDRYKWDVDALTAANLIPTLIPRRIESIHERPEQRPAEDPRHVFANKADRKNHERTLRRLHK